MAGAVVLGVSLCLAIGSIVAGADTGWDDGANGGGGNSIVGFVTPSGFCSEDMDGLTVEAFLSLVRESITAAGDSGWFPALPGISCGGAAGGCAAGFFWPIGRVAR